ncbi:MAG: prenyltransferase [Candidatus Aminicenantes bacterium]|nr:prenyltransferase [Candidatus Aminicenantes bacterium]
MTEQNQQVSPIKKWFIAARPWALPASTMPVIFGTSLAVVIGGAHLDFPRFLLALVAMVLIHSGANMLSDVFDFKRGLDRVVTPVSGALPRGWLSTRAVTIGAILLFIIGSGVGIVLFLMTGTVLLIIGAIGVVIGVFYTLLKYNAFGDLAVFLDFGILGSLGAWVVQTKSFSWIPVAWTVPMAMLVSAILHANNWRDINTDTEKNVRTMASTFGDRGSLLYYGFLIFGPYAVFLVLIFIPRLPGINMAAMPLTFFLAFAGLFQAGKLWGRAVRRKNPRHPLEFVILDGATSTYNLTLGLLCTAAVWLHFFLKGV